MAMATSLDYHGIQVLEVVDVDELHLDPDGWRAPIGAIRIDHQGTTVLLGVPVDDVGENLRLHRRPSRHPTGLTRDTDWVRRCSTDEQDLAAQHQALADLGVHDDRIYVDHGLTGANRDRPGLGKALAAVRAGDTLVVPKLDGLARSVPDARDIGDSLAQRGVALSRRLRL